MLRIGDPKNLESLNPAIKKAAEIKVEEDLKPQKIKAIKFLARTGCGCYEGVAEALIAALSDCTEEVRYEAARALRDAAGQKCGTCNGSCCSEKVSEAMYKRAYERDDAGCWIEPSERVRGMLRQALCACSVPGLPEIVTEPIKEGPVEGPVKEGPETPPPPPPAASVPVESERSVKVETSVPARQVSVEKSAQVVVAQVENEEIDLPPVPPAAVLRATPVKVAKVPAKPVAKKEVAKKEVAVVAEPVAAKPEQSDESKDVDDAVKLFQPQPAVEEEAVEAPVKPQRSAVTPATRREVELKPAMPKEIVAPAPQKTAKAPAAKGTPSQGDVAVVNPHNGTVQLQFGEGQPPQIGSTVKVFHQSLLRTTQVGELNIVGHRGPIAYAKPVGSTKLDKISKGDKVVIHKVAPAVAAEVAIADEASEEVAQVTETPAPAPAKVAVREVAPAKVAAPSAPATQRTTKKIIQVDAERVGPAIWGIDD